MALKRNVKSNIDQASIDNLVFNQKAGAEKNMEVGRPLLALDDGSGGKTTNATTAKSLPALGKCIAVYNNAATLAAITLGSDNTVTALAAGVTSGSNVGVPCKPNDWTYLACNDKRWVIASTATLLVFLIDDDSELSSR